VPNGYPLSTRNPSWRRPSWAAIDAIAEAVCSKNYVGPVARPHRSYEEALLYSYLRWLKTRRFGTKGCRLFEWRDRTRRNSSKSAGLFGGLAGLGWASSTLANCWAIQRLILKDLWPGARRRKIRTSD